MHYYSFTIIIIFNIIILSSINYMPNIYYGKIINGYNHLNVNQNNKIIETIFNVGGTNETINETSVKNLSEKTQNITKDMIVNSTSKLLNKAINEATANNSAEITQALSASNKISVSGSKGKGFKLSGIKQTSKVDSKVEGEIIQKIANKMNNDISNSISKSFEKTTSDINKLKEDISKATDVGKTLSEGIGAVAGVANNLVNAAADVAANAINIGGTNREVNKKNIENTIRETLNLSDKFEVDDNDDVENIIKNQMSQENLAKCANQAAAANEINLQDIDGEGGAIEITDIEQESLVNSAMSCAFNQEIVNEMANKIVNNLEKIFKQVNESMTEEERKEKSGDLLALGEGSAMLMAATGEAVGDAAVGVGEGVSTAAKGAGEGIKGAGEGISTAAKGVGEGASAILSSMVMPLIVIAIIALVAGGAYYLYKRG